jgi:NitT/TauT family transport system substrate-binding protein
MSSSAPGLTHVVLQTDWYAEPEHGGFYQALVKGYYQEAGLDVEIRQGTPTTLPQQAVATGQADIAIGASSDVILAASRGIPFVMLGAYMERDPQGILFHKESGILGFKDLDGRRIMAVPGSPFLDVIQRKFQIKLAVTPTDFGISRFLADKGFIQQCFVTNEPFYVKKMGADAGVLLISEGGFSPYRVMYARRDFIKAHGDIARAFVTASMRGWREYVSGDPSEANARIASLNSKMDPAFMAFAVQAMKDYKLVGGDPAAGDALGKIQRTRIATGIQQLSDIGLLDKPVKAEDVFDERFMPL